MGRILERPSAGKYRLFRSDNIIRACLKEHGKAVEGGPEDRCGTRTSG